jgi:hypothetical protein
VRRGTNLNLINVTSSEKSPVLIDEFEVMSSNETTPPEIFSYQVEENGSIMRVSDKLISILVLLLKVERNWTKGGGKEGKREKGREGEGEKRGEGWKDT